SAISQKIPYIIILGENEINNGTISVRQRGTNQTTEYNIDEFLTKLQNEIKERV
ncbi:MAG: threonine--tRNA ligase, partial [Clostridia bacterium]|nr:threonine--tRNA ligase [Clostridia bacterium]